MVIGFWIVMVCDHGRALSAHRGFCHLQVKCLVLPMLPMLPMLREGEEGVKEAGNGTRTAT